MKINWGKGIVIGMVLFIGFIMFLVITMITDKRYEHDLVTESYYQKEMELQDDIYAQQNAVAMTDQIHIGKSVDGYVIQFPKTFSPDKLSGKVFLYRPSNKELDFEIPIDINSSNLLIPKNRLLDGRWDITIDWAYEGRSYRVKKQIIY